MPIYEYKCTKCNDQFEVTQRITDAALTKCSICGGELKKLITNTSFVLKGSGWYTTDYPSADRKKAMEAKKSADTKKGAKPKKETDKTETKKAEASETK